MASRSAKGRGATRPAPLCVAPGVYRAREGRRGILEDHAAPSPGRHKSTVHRPLRNRLSDREPRLLRAARCWKFPTLSARHTPGRVALRGRAGRGDGRGGACVRPCPVSPNGGGVRGPNDGRPGAPVGVPVASRRQGSPCTRMLHPRARVHDGRFGLRALPARIFTPYGVQARGKTRARSPLTNPKSRARQLPARQSPTPCPRPGPEGPGTPSLPVPTTTAS